MVDLALLQEYTDIFAPSGFESPIRDRIAEKILPFVDTLKIDGVGNLIATKGDPSQILICAHMDEVGFMVTEITENGRLLFSAIGGVDPKFLSGKRVLVGKEKILGVIGAKPVHLSKKEKKELAFADLYIDIGTDAKLETEKHVSIGDLVSFETRFSLLSDPDQTICAKALDNRIGAYILTKLLMENAISDGTFVFTVQEETGLSGAAAIANSTAFAFGIALDTTTANDLHGVEDHRKVCCLGGGAVLPFVDGATVYDRDLLRRITKALDQERVSWQTKTKRAGGNDASALEKQGLGMHVVSLATPCRYIHGSVGIAKQSDIVCTQKALLCICRCLKGEKYD